VVENEPFVFRYTRRIKLCRFSFKGNRIGQTNYVVFVKGLNESTEFNF
jgi:hypothetical protein